MTAEFYGEYLRTSQQLQRLLYAMNPNKFRACEYLMRYHEERGDKIIIFSDNVIALRLYGNKLQVPYIDGSIPQNERMQVGSRSLTINRCAFMMITRCRLFGNSSIAP